MGSCLKVSKRGRLVSRPLSKLLVAETDASSRSNWIKTIGGPVGGWKGQGKGETWRL